MEIDNFKNANPLEKKPEYVVSGDIVELVIEFINASIEANNKETEKEEENTCRKSLEKEEENTCRKSLEKARTKFRKELETILSDYTIEYIDENSLRKYLTEKVQESNNIINISLDNIYLSKNPNIYYLDLTRCRQYLNKDETLLVGRKNLEPLETMVEDLASQIRIQNKDIANFKIRIFDDIIYGGDTLLKIIEEFKKRGINIETVVAGIILEKSYKKLNKRINVRLKETSTNKIEVKLDKAITDNIETIEYNMIFNKIIDEVCERDFVFGLRNSGKYYLNRDNVATKKPYFKPFGEPKSDASISEKKVNKFSLACLEFSINVWKIIKKTLNKEKILVNDIIEYNKKFTNIPIHGVFPEDNSKNISTFLKQKIKYIQNQKTKKGGMCPCL
jgi:hypothetical protein